MGDLNQLHDAILNGDADRARDLTSHALQSGSTPLSLVDEFMIPAMNEVGRRFEAEEYFVPELLRSARAMKSAMALLRPLLLSNGTKSLGRIVLGTVAGDVHEIGKHLVAAMLEGGGFEIIDLGTGVTPDRYLAAVREHEPHIIGMSALLTTTMPAMKATITALAVAGLRDQIKVLVGGAPVTAEFAQEIGADGFSNNAPGAVVAAKLLLGLPATRTPGVYLCTR